MTLPLEASYGLLRSDVGARLVARDAVVVTGPDAVGWLQGQLSQDVAGLAVGQSAETLVLSPQGKIDAAGRLTVLADDAVLIDTEAGFGAQLHERLRRFKLRVQAELATGSVACLELRGPRAAEAAGGLEARVGGEPVGEQADPADVLAGSGTIRAEVTWPGGGVDVLGHGAEQAVSFGLAPVCDPGAFEALRIEAGVPRLGRELTERTIAQEVPGLVERTVSFTKGCFTGQELVARLDARGGNVPRHLRLVVLEPGATEPELGAELASGERMVGAVTSVAYSPGLGAFVALAFVHRSVAPPCTLLLAGKKAELVELPLTRP